MSLLTSLLYADNGKLLVFENVLPAGNEPSLGMLMDLEMLLMTSGGRERTASEFDTLFASDSFHLTKITPTESSLNAIKSIRV